MTENELLKQLRETNDALVKIEIAHTPESWDEIVKFIVGASTPADAATAAMMAWNKAVEWHHKQDRCCEELRKMRARGDEP
jgi:hypothetical protein